LFGKPPTWRGGRSRLTPVRQVPIQKPLKEAFYDYFGHIEEIIFNTEDDKRPKAVVTILDIKITGLLDSGASCTTLGKDGEELVKRLGLKIFEKNILVRTADGTPHTVKGFVYAPFTFDNRLRIIPALLIPTLSRELILGIDFWENFDIKPKIERPSMNPVEETSEITKATEIQTDHDLTCVQKSRLARIIDTLRPKTEKIVPTKMMIHKIDTGDSEPVRSKPYSFSPAIEKKIHAEIDRMLQLDVIERSQSPWRNPVVVVPKSDGRVRLCLDSRKLNSVTVKDAYVIPNLNRILGRLSGTKYLTTIDMADSFGKLA
jgi:Aspartyl protease